MEDDYMFCVGTLQLIRNLAKEEKPRNREQRIAIFFHFTFLRSGFRVLSSQKKRENEGGVGSSNQQIPTINNSQSQISPNWKNDTSAFSFEYTHPDFNNNNSNSQTTANKNDHSENVIQLKIVPMGSTLIVHCAVESQNSILHSFEFNMNDYISEYMTENEAEYKWKSLQVQFKNAIIYELLPSLKPPPTQATSVNPPPSTHKLASDPFYISPNRQPDLFSNRYAPQFSNPFNAGHSDLNPPFADFGGVAGGGTQVGPDHPIFSGGIPYPGQFSDPDIDYHPFFPAPSHPFIPNPQPQFPHPAPPPGARYDPFNPIDPLKKKKTNDPDPDHLPMPGNNDDWYI